MDLIGSAGAQGSTAGTFRSGFGGGSELLELDESTSGSKAGFVMLKFIFYNFERYALFLARRRIFGKYLRGQTSMCDSIKT